MAVGVARLRIDGREIGLHSPRLVKKDIARPQLPDGTKTPPGIAGESDLLCMDVLPD